MTNQNDQTTVDAQKRKAELDARLGDIGWAVLLITIGTMWLLPEKQVPQGSWMIAAGPQTAASEHPHRRTSGFKPVVWKRTCAMLGALPTNRAYADACGTSFCPERLRK